MHCLYKKKETCARLLQTVRSSETPENAINETTTTQEQPTTYIAYLKAGITVFLAIN